MAHSRSGLSRDDRENILGFLLISLPAVFMTAYLFYVLYKKSNAPIKATPVMQIPFKPVPAQKKIQKKPSQEKIKIVKNAEEETSQTYLATSYNSSDQNKETDSAKIRRNRETTNMIKKTEIQLLIEERNKNKMLKRSQDAISTAEKAEKTKGFKQIRAVTIAQKKLTPSQEKIFYKKDKSPDTLTDSSGSSSEQPSVTKQAKKNLVKHSEYLLKFSYYPPSTPDASKLNFIKTLAFLYNFHRYNLSRRVLFSIVQNEKDSENKSNAVKLRTQIVHGANKIFLHYNLILETQNKLSEWIANEVADLRQKGSFVWVKADQTQQNLFSWSGTTPNQVTFESMQTLPLYKELYQLKEQLNLAPNSPQNTSNMNFYLWMKNAVIPFLNQFSVAARVLTHEERDGIKMMLIIFGEYCSSKRDQLIKHYFPNIETDRNIDVDDVTNFISSCRTIRNTLSHDIFDITNDEIDTTLALASKINNHLLIEEFDSVLTPEPKINVSSPSLK